MAEKADPNVSNVDPGGCLGCVLTLAMIASAAISPFLVGFMLYQMWEFNAQTVHPATLQQCYELCHKSMDSWTPDVCMCKVDYTDFVDKFSHGSTGGTGI